MAMYGGYAPYNRPIGYSQASPIEQFLVDSMCNFHRPGQKLVDRTGGIETGMLTCIH